MAWDNLFYGRWARFTRALVGVGCTIALYLFWVPVVGVVQTMASLRALARLPVCKPWLQELLDALGTTTVVWAETQLSALILATCRSITLECEIFQYLARLQGLTSHTAVSAMSAGRQMLFQLVMVVIFPGITKSLADTLIAMLNDPYAIPRQIANSLTPASTLFLNYVGNAFLFVALFDVLQVTSLLYYACSRAWAAIRAACCGPCAGG